MKNVILKLNGQELIDKENMTGSVYNKTIIQNLYNIENKNFKFKWLIYYI